MSNIFYPERLRCKNCRKGLEQTVIDGLFCSYRCAKLPEPKSNVVDAPRQCKKMVNNVWEFKKRYRYVGEVSEKLQSDPNTNIYKCDYCRHYHVGHSRPMETVEKLHRQVNSFQELGSVIKRYRVEKNIDKKVIAKKLKVPVIRITEIEEGHAKANPQILFSLLYLLRIKVEVKA